MNIDWMMILQLLLGLAMVLATVGILIFVIIYFAKKAGDKREQQRQSAR
jgi:flagellar biogenesis protein FliO